MDQTYLIKNLGIGNPKRHVFFRFGNWCYQGNLELGFTNEINLSDLRVMMPILQRLQGQLSPKCEFYNTTRDSTPIKAVDSINKLIKIVTDELTELDETVEQIITRNGGSDDEVNTFFKIEVSPNFNLKVFEDYELVISKNFFKYIVVHTILIGRNIFVALSDSSGNNQLLNTQFPNLKVDHLTVEVKSYESPRDLRAVSLCFIDRKQLLETKKEVLEDEASDEKSRFQELGYNHVYLFMKSSTGVPNKSKELFFKFGDWCYHGCINLPFEEIMEKDLSVVFHELVPQKKNLHSICKYGKLPSESKYKAFKEIDDDFPENECLISKVYLNESIIYLFYKDKKYIVGLYSASYDNALLDVFFPNIYSRFSDMNNYDLETYPSSTGFSKLSIWIPKQEQTEGIFKTNENTTFVGSISPERNRTRNMNKNFGDSKDGDDKHLESKGIKNISSPVGNSAQSWVRGNHRIEPLAEKKDQASGVDIFKKPNPFK